ncbi:hypothetical protein ACFSQ7_30395 [Paenibacillus rhizoplanae]
MEHTWEGEQVRHLNEQEQLFIGRVLEQKENTLQYCVQLLAQ